ncbi:hypothetical protein TNCV_3338291 [Trichonephila clavipes]|nr:hypothetical protein TNCV_3338291 [Trichonephila clavipes]
MARSFVALSGRRNSRHTGIMQILAFTAGVQSSVSFWRHLARKTRYWEAENISRGYRKNGTVFFSVMSRNVPYEVILVKSAPGEKMELAFSLC